MNEQQRRGPGEAAGDGRAQHGYRNEVTWEGGKGQPYTNQGGEELGPAAATEVEGGNRGDASGRTLDQLEQLKRKPDRPRGGKPRAGPEGAYSTPNSISSRTMPRGTPRSQRMTGMGNLLGKLSPA